MANSPASTQILEFQTPSSEFIRPFHSVALGILERLTDPNLDIPPRTMSERSQPKRFPEFCDRRLKRIGEILADDTSRRNFIAKIYRAGRILATIAVAGYALVLIAGILCFRFIGESNLTIAYLLYFPRIVFLIPAIIVFPIGLLFCRRVSVLLAITSAIFIFYSMGWKLRPEPTATPSSPGTTLTVLTYNRGQHANQSLQPFKNLTDPDVIVLQEAGSRAAGYASAEGYEKFLHTIDEAEFTILSRYPILAAESIRVPSSQNEIPVAARFEIDFEGGRIALYAIHVISPRDALRSYRRGAFLWGVLGIPGTPFGKKREAYQVFWDNRIEEARTLRQIILEDPLPTLIAGDLNAPAGGYIHGLFRSEFEDAHPAGGERFRLHFPRHDEKPAQSRRTVDAVGLPLL